MCSKRITGNKAKELRKARHYAFLLLKFRPQSEKEILARLKERRFASAVIKETLAFLKAEKLLNDNELARNWIEVRLKKPLSLERVAEELKAKGIAQKIIQAEIQQVKKDYCPEEVIKKLVKERQKKIRDIESQKAKQRIFAYLVGRGFSPELVREILNQDQAQY